MKLQITKDELRGLIKAAYIDGFDDGAGVGAQLTTEQHHDEALNRWPDSVTLDNLEQDLRKGKWT